MIIYWDIEAVLQAHDDSIVQHRSCITSTRWQHRATQKLYYKHTMTASCNTEAVLQAHDDSIVQHRSCITSTRWQHHYSIKQYRSSITSTRWQHRAIQKLYYKHTMTASCNTEAVLQAHDDSIMQYREHINSLITQSSYWKFTIPMQIKEFLNLSVPLVSHRSKESENQSWCDYCPWMSSTTNVSCCKLS